MKFVEYLECVECGRRYDPSQLHNLCVDDARPLQMKLDTEAIAKAYPNESWYHPEIKSMWRFGPLLPFDIQKHPNDVVTMGEGHTPIIELSTQFARELNLKVYIKDEGIPHKHYGANPTGSFKDRGMAMVATMAKHFGLEKLVVPTQGNAGDSLACYSNNHDFQLSVIMPDNTPMPIMGNVAALSYKNPNIKMHLVKGTIREAGALMKEKFLPNYFNCATFQEPGWRIEGKKTMGAELAEPWPGIKDKWQLPDVVFYPIGGGTGILGMWKCFEELEELGVIDGKRPRIIAVQPESNAPIVHAIENQFDDTHATSGGDTMAVGLNVPGGVGHKKVLEIIRLSNGDAFSISESEIETQMRDCFAEQRLWLSPEGAACVAALAKAKAKGLLSKNHTIVCFNTGSPEKYWPLVKHCFLPG